VVFNLDEKDSEIEIQIDNEKFIRLIESSSEKWCGPGKFAPDEVSGKSKISLQKFSFVLYINKE
jgi:hypothetical protein